MTTISCPYCGVSNHSGFNFCNHCGKRLTSVNDTENQSDPMSDGESLDHLVATDRHTGEAKQQEREPRQSESTSSTTQPTDREFTTNDSNLVENQPWLQPEPEPDLSEFGQHQASSEPSKDVRGTTRLLTGVQGLLTPLTISPGAPTTESDKPGQQPTRDANQQHFSSTSALPELEEARLRFWRQVIQREPLQRTESLLIGARDRIVLRIPWIFGLLGLCVGIPILLQFGGPMGQPQQLNGISNAFQAIEDLPSNAVVLIYWAYDPSTAGEMDLVAQPVLYHLLKQNSQLVLVSLLPGGPASARRLLRQIENETDVRFISPQPIDNGYLPGGAAILPLFGHNLAHVLAPALTEDSTAASISRINSLRSQDIQPALSLVLAARAEDAQEWLEQVQPLTSKPLIAAVSAGADPILRPYLDSGQLLGLASGVDGASVYQAFLAQPQQLFDQNQAERISTVEPWPNDQLRRHLIVQNWGQLTFIIIIILGNLSLLTSQRAKEDVHDVQRDAQ